MKMGLLSWLASPCCREPMRFASLDRMPDPKADIEEGSLACGSCRREYPIAGSVPRLILEEQIDARVAATSRSFTWEWLRYPGSLDEDREVFLEECQLEPGDLQGKLVLDAGCGMGRYTLVALSLGAEAAGLDLSGSLARLVPFASEEERLHVVQGDLLKPPLRAGFFDLVFSHGVLHHTKDAHAAFLAVAGLVKPGGLLSVWLYGKAGRFEDFATNPLRPDRAWVDENRRLAWFVVGARHLVSDILRLFTTRLPLALAYGLCFPLAALGALPLLKYLTFSVHPSFRVRLIENFDWLTPPFQSHHTKEELAAWCEEAGFEVLKVLPHGLIPKPGVLARRRRG
ncbi:MAG: methyltransferase domain-containing protein [Elusimicrobia bacterium]|nr:methyltransferase domain-containing protein [Elusimicrobiota bacterium]